MTANNEYKLKQWNADNKSCRKTTLGPTFGGFINRLEQINHIHTDGQSRPSEFAAYGTADKVVGLVSWAKAGKVGSSYPAPPANFSHMDVGEESRKSRAPRGGTLR